MSRSPSVVSILLGRRMLICVVTGFSSGLPLYLLLNLVPAWLRTEGVSLKAIGLLTLIQAPYTWKFLWSPLLDRYTLPFLGRRRGWMVVTQVALMAMIALLGQFAPQEQLTTIAMLAALLAFLSATQDIVLDAYRRELLPEIELGLGNAVHVNAYKIAGLVPGALSLVLADHLPWAQVFLLTSLFMLPGMLLSMTVSEPPAASAPKTLRAAIVEPIRDFLERDGWRSALYVLLFIFLYKLGDSLCTALATPFYLDMGFTKSDVGMIAKNAGLWASVAGGLVGGVWMLRLGINRALWVFGAAQMLAILGFAWLAVDGPYTQVGLHERVFLAGVIGTEAFGVGLGTAAFVAYVARNTNPAYTATQFALFTSLAAVPRTFINAGSGWLVEWLGWFSFYGLCFVLAIPGMLLLTRIAPWRGEESGTPGS
jgi:PAT family beta-lactamase induction signal transducer AmpG